jgi:K+ transporter
MIQRCDGREASFSICLCCTVDLSNILKEAIFISLSGTNIWTLSLSFFFFFFGWTMSFLSNNLVICFSGGYLPMLYAFIYVLFKNTMCLEI